MKCDISRKLLKGAPDGFGKLQKGEVQSGVSSFPPACLKSCWGLPHAACRLGCRLGQELFPWSLLSQGKAWSHVLEADCGLLLETQYALWRVCSFASCSYVCVCVCACGLVLRLAKTHNCYDATAQNQGPGTFINMKQEGFGVISSFFIIFCGFSALLPSDLVQ